MHGAGAVSKLAGHLLVNNFTVGQPKLAASAPKLDIVTALRQPAGPCQNCSLVAVTGPSMASVPCVLVLVEDGAQQWGCWGAAAPGCPVEAAWRKAAASGLSPGSLRFPQHSPERPAGWQLT